MPLLKLHDTDITHASAVAETVDRIQPDAIVHLAAIHYIPECEENPDLAVSTNVAGTVNLLNACHPGMRFVYASSAAVYAPAPGPHREDGSIAPADIYGWSKLHGEQYVKYFVE